MPKFDPRAHIEHLESGVDLPAGNDERFNGFGVMGLPFHSGHILALRRFPASSIGPGYTSVWHRDPAGAWTFYADVPPRQACTRFFGEAARAAVEARIEIAWPSPSRLRVTMDMPALEWDVTVGPTMATRIMNAMGRLLPARAWRNPGFLKVMARVGGPVLRVGRVGLHGVAPNGQHFIANPRLLWAVTDSRAVLDGDDFGLPGPVEPQARLGDFWIPQRGMLAIGQSFFDTFDPTRHSARTSR